MKNNNGALRQQVVENIAPIRRYAYALTGTAHDADDLLQATVERVLKKGAPQDADMAKWMYRICKNIWIDEIRSRKVRSSAVESGKMEGGEPVDGERVVINRMTLAEVNVAMEQLPDAQRAVLSLVAIEGYSYREAADILEMPIGTVMSRLARARATLSNLLARPSEAAERGTDQLKKGGNDD